MTGRNTAARVTDIEITAKKISFEPLMAASIGLYPSSSFLNIFSVTTIPSSTTKPVARTIARSVSTLMENPKRYMIKKVDINETGISISGLKAILQSRKNKKMMRITSISEIRMVSETSVTERLIKIVVSMAISVL